MNDRLRTRLLAAVTLLCLGAAAWITFAPERRPGRTQRTDLADQLAAWIAREAKAGDTGPLLLLAPAEDAADPFPGALAARAEKHMTRVGFSPIVVLRVPYAPGLESSGEPFSEETLREALLAHPESRAVLSLVGLPRLTTPLAPAGGKPVRLFAASTVKMDYLDAIPAGVVEFVIGVRNDSAGGAPGDPALGELGRYFTLKRWP